MNLRSALPRPPAQELARVQVILAQGKRSRVETVTKLGKGKRRNWVETDTKGKRTGVERVEDSGPRPTGTSTDIPRALGYIITNIPEDRNCFFHSVGHGSRLSRGMDAPGDEIAQWQLAAELPSKVADELIKRRDFMADFILEDFDEYVEKLRHPKKWGGDPELLMLSYVLEYVLTEKNELCRWMPITVYKFEDPVAGKGPLVFPGEYGQEYKFGTI